MLIMGERVKVQFSGGGGGTMLGNIIGIEREDDGTPSAVLVRIDAGCTLRVVVPQLRSAGGTITAIHLN